MSPIIKNSQQISPYHKTFYNNRIDISQRKKISVINTNNNIQSNKNRSIKKINSSNLDNK